LSTRGYTEIYDLVLTLESQFDQLRREALSRYELYAMRMRPELQKDVSRLGQVDVLSPLLEHAAMTLRADMILNPTEFTVVPTGRGRDGAVPHADEVKADVMEKGSAVMWGKLNHGRAVDLEVVWHQLLSPFGVMILHCNELTPPDQGKLSDREYAKIADNWEKTRFPWTVETPDPLSCFWPVRGGRRPVVFARRYKQLALDTKRIYGHRPNTEFADGSLDVKPNGDWMWVSDAHRHDAPTQMRSTMDLKEHDMLWLDDGETIYHVAMNMAGGKEGIVVWSGKNLTGSVTGFVVPGYQTPLREPHDRFLPFLHPLMQTVLNLNRIRTLRATISQNQSHPKSYQPMPPDIIKARMDAGLPPMPDPIVWEDGVTPNTWAKLESFPTNPDPDLDKLEQALLADIPRFLPTTTETIDTAVLRATTATAILHLSETVQRRLNEMTATYDVAIADVMNSVIKSIPEYGVDFSVYATGQEIVHGKSLQAGDGFALTPTSVDFPHELIVMTSRKGQAQVHAAFQAWLEQYQAGIATFEDGLDAAGFNDKQGQLLKLTKEALLREVTPVAQMQALAAARQRIRLRSGIDLPLGEMGLDPAAGAAAVNPQLPTPSETGGTPGQYTNGNMMSAPNVPGPQGGSSSSVMT
jgi:hypothetical protein